MSLICNWFDDWGIAIKEGLGQTWMIVLLALFSFVALYLLQDILRASINKTKIVMKWGELFFLAIFVFFIVWFCTLL